MIKLSYTTSCNIMYRYVYLGKTPMTWRNLNRGRHTIAVEAFCVDDEGKRSSIVRRNFNFRIP